MSVITGEPVQRARESSASVDAAQAARGFEEYRAHVGPADRYDVFSAVQFNLLTSLGLRDEHTLLDVGCGSLRAGRLFIPYLRPGHYFAIEPLPWLVQEGIEREMGADQVRIKRPTFSHDGDFTLTTFGRQFDFILAQSIFSHTSQAQMRRCFSEAKKALKPGGVFAATFFEGAENYEGDEWVAKSTYTMQRLRELVEEQGLALTPIEWRHPDMQRWVLIHHPGAGVRLPEVTDTERAMRLEEQLALSRQHLASIRNHPYVKFGMRVKFFLVWLAFERRRVARWLRERLGGSKS